MNILLWTIIIVIAVLGIGLPFLKLLLCKKEVTGEIVERKKKGISNEDGLYEVTQAKIRYIYEGKTYFTRQNVATSKYSIDLMIWTKQPRFNYVSKKSVISTMVVSLFIICVLFVLTFAG